MLCALVHHFCVCACVRSGGSSRGVVLVNYKYKCAWVVVCCCLRGGDVFSSLLLLFFSSPLTQNNSIGYREFITLITFSLNRPYEKMSYGIMVIPYIIYHLSYIIYHLSYIIYHISYIIYHISYHISYIIYHISYIIYHLSSSKCEIISDTTPHT